MASKKGGVLILPEAKGFDGGGWWIIWFFIIIIIIFALVGWN
jgi:hypothetical protein